MNPAPHTGRTEFDADSFDFTGYRMPAEWEPQHAIWLAWPKNAETWPQHMAEARRAYAEMIAAITRHQNVILLAESCPAIETIEEFLAPYKIHKERLRIIHIPYNDSWMRDAGPIFINKPGSDLPQIAHDFIFNAWGAKYEPYDADDAIPQHAADMFGFPLIRHSMVLEGGSIDVNGHGTVLTTRQCLLNKNRNPNLNQQQIEDNLRHFLGVQRVLWLDEGIEGDDTDGHIDDITRFVAPNRVITVLENHKNDANYQPLRENLTKLKTYGDQDGNKLEVVDIPMPDIHVEGPFGRSPASYANFLIADKSVLLPVYSAPNQESVLTIFRDLFPGREIVPIECSGLVAGLGSIHCVTQQQPALP